MKPILKELLWLTAAAGFTVLIAILLFSKRLLFHDLDIHFHDTYMVIFRWHILIPVFLFSCFLLYFIKEKRKSFTRGFQNWITLVSGFLLLILLSYLISVFSQSMFSWTIYPPLSALGKDQIPESDVNHFTKKITKGLYLVQLFVILLLFYFLYSWGKNKKLP